MKKPTLAQMVAFAVLMENDGGILDKSPDYVEEKFNAVFGWCEDQPQRLLDTKNLDKLDKWFKTWMPKEA